MLNIVLYEWMYGRTKHFIAWTHLWIIKKGRRGHKSTNYLAEVLPSSSFIADLSERHFIDTHVQSHFQVSSPLLSHLKNWYQAKMRGPTHPHIPWSIFVTLWCFSPLSQRHPLKQQGHKSDFNIVSCLISALLQCILANSWCIEDSVSSAFHF